MKQLIPFLLVFSMGCDDEQKDTSVPVDTNDTTDTNIDADPPIAIIAPIDSTYIGETVTLDGSESTDTEGYNIEKWEWSCSDGTTASGATANVTFSSAGEQSCTLTVTSSSTLTDNETIEFDVMEDPRAEWTFMVFIAGDNNLSMYGMKDLNEMERAGSTNDVNIIVQMDRAKNDGGGDGNWSGGRRYYVKQDDDPLTLNSELIEDLGAIDSGKPETVIEFTDWAIEAYPAQKYALILWDHGWGWDFQPNQETKGVLTDDRTGSELSIAGGDLETILEAVNTKIGSQLSLLGMDACLMNNWETAYVSSPYANVYVASQDSEGMEGWAYNTAMTDLISDPEMDAQTLGDFIALRFNESGDSTLSVLDLTLMNDLTNSLDTFAQAMIDSNSSNSILRGAAKNAQSFDWGGSDHDLGHLLTLIKDGATTPTEVVTAAENVLSIYENLVLSNYTNGSSVKNATGTTIYSPASGGYSPKYNEGTWSSETLWDDMIKAALTPPK